MLSECTKEGPCTRSSDFPILYSKTFQSLYQAELKRNIRDMIVNIFESKLHVSFT